jgi:flagellar protein FlaG
MVIDSTTSLPVASSAPDPVGPRVNGSAAAPSANSTPAPQSRPAQQPTRAAVEAAAQELQDYVASAGRTLEFRLDESTGMTVVTVKDTESGDVIRQIPSEEVLKIAESLKGRLDKTSNVLLSLTA